MSLLFLFYFIIFDGNLSFYLFAVDDDEHVLLRAIENDSVSGDMVIKQSHESIQTGPWYLALASQPWPTGAIFPVCEKYCNTAAFGGQGPPIIPIKARYKICRFADFLSMPILGFF